MTRQNRGTELVYLSPFQGYHIQLSKLQTHGKLASLPWDLCLPAWNCLGDG